MLKKGKYLLAFLLGSIILFPFNAFAAEKTSSINSGDTTWMLICTAIVIFMHVPGLALFYGGLVSERNVVSTMMHSFVSLLYRCNEEV